MDIVLGLRNHEILTETISHSSMEHFFGGPRVNPRIAENFLRQVAFFVLFLSHRDAITGLIPPELKLPLLVAHIFLGAYYVQKSWLQS